MAFILILGTVSLSHTYFVFNTICTVQIFTEEHTGSKVKATWVESRNSGSERVRCVCVCVFDYVIRVCRNICRYVYFCERLVRLFHFYSNICMYCILFFWFFCFTQIEFPDLFALFFVVVNDFHFVELIHFLYSWNKELFGNAEMQAFYFQYKHDVNIFGYSCANWIYSYEFKKSKYSENQKKAKNITLLSENTSICDCSPILIATHTTRIRTLTARHVCSSSLCTTSKINTWNILGILFEFDVCGEHSSYFSHLSLPLQSMLFVSNFIPIYFFPSLGEIAVDCRGANSVNQSLWWCVWFFPHVASLCAPPPFSYCYQGATVTDTYSCKHMVLRSVHQISKQCTQEKTNSMPSLPSIVYIFFLVYKQLAHALALLQQFHRFSTGLPSYWPEWLHFKCA